MDAALQRLRDPDDAALRALIALTVDHALDRPLTVLVDPPALADVARRWAARLRATPDARARFVAAVDRARSVAAAPPRDAQTMRAALPPPAVEAARAALGLPWSPSAHLTRQVLAHPALHELVRAVLGEVLSGFVERVRRVDQGVLGGLGGRAADRGGRLLGGFMGGLSQAADGLLGAARDELTRALDQRLSEFLGGATDQAVELMAVWIADPAHAPELAAMRLGALDTLLDTPASAWADEAQSISTEAVIAPAWEALILTLEDPALPQRIADAADLAQILSPAATLGGALDELGLRDAARDACADLLTPHGRRLLASDAFAAWWAGLHAQAPTS
jgi:hypothetical protein